MDSPEVSSTFSSRTQPKYKTLEYYHILMTLYWLFSGVEFLILCSLPNKIDFVLSSPKWILNLLSTSQSQSIPKFLFSATSISIISYSWNIKQVSSAYGNSSQLTVSGISFICCRKRSSSKMNPWGIQDRSFPGSEKVFFRWT